MSEQFYSRVYENRPEYAKLDSPEKFQAIIGIIGTRLRQHPNAVCSYSGGSDSDIMLDLLELARDMFNLPPIQYVFFNTGLEMKATKDHVQRQRERYGVEIKEYRPSKNIVQATREHGQPFVSKIMSQGLEGWQKKGIPITIHEDYLQAEDKKAFRKELSERYPKCESLINFICCCNREGEHRPDIQLVINSSRYMYEFVRDNPPEFKISSKCCDYCKKQLAHRVQKGYEMIITGERRDEGGMRSVPTKSDEPMCFTENANGQFRFKPLYYVSDKDKEWWKQERGLKYSDAYEIYGLKRTGCCGCPISYRAVDDLELIGKYEPQIVKAAWNIFGDSYRYRQAYNEYKRNKVEEEKKKKDGYQMSIFDVYGEDING